MHYYVHFVNEAYVFLFENDENHRAFKGTFNFVLENLRVEDENEGTTTLKVEL